MSVTYATADGLVDPATENVDDVPADGTLMFAPGQTTKKIKVSIDDLIQTPAESIVNELAMMLLGWSVFILAQTTAGRDPRQQGNPSRPPVYPPVYFSLVTGQFRP